MSLSPRLEFGWEPIDRALADGFDELAIMHWEEAEGEIAYEPDWDQARYLERSGAFRVFTARLAGTLVGYSVWVIAPALHHRNTLHAFNSAVYLDPEHRRGRNGVRLIQSCEAALAELGVKRIIYAAKPHVHLGSGRKTATLGRLLDLLGYRLFETMYAKILEG